MFFSAAAILRYTAIFLNFPSFSNFELQTSDIPGKFRYKVWNYRRTRHFWNQDLPLDIFRHDSRLDQNCRHLVSCFAVILDLNSGITYSPAAVGVDASAGASNCTGNFGIFAKPSALLEIRRAIASVGDLRARRVRFRERWQFPKLTGNLKTSSTDEGRRQNFMSLILTPFLEFRIKCRKKEST